MRTIIHAIIAFLAFCTILSCKKSKQPTLNHKPFIPIDVLGLMPQKAQSIYTFGTTLAGYDGVFTACRVTGRGTDTSGLERVYNGNWESATIVIPTPSMQNSRLMDRVFANDTELHWVQYVSDASSAWCIHKDSLPILDEGQAIRWAAKGNIDIPQFSISIPGVYPAFWGTFPDSISIQKEFLFVFNSADLSNTDSAFVLLYNNGGILGTSKVHGDGFATISRPAIASFKTNSAVISMPDNIPNGITFRGNGYMMVVLFKTEERKISGKRYALVQQSIFFKPVQFY